MVDRPEIEKSLFDKRVESFVYNPNIVVNRNSKNIKQKIIKLLDLSDRVDIAVSYSVWSGLSLIYDHLKKFKSDSRLILTIEGFVTDPKSLEKLNDLDMSVKVYAPTKNGKGFHLKTYMFEKEDHRTLLVGSANISSRAFGLVHEMAIEVDAEKDGYIVQEYNEVFEDLWNDKFSEELCKEYVEAYTITYNDKKAQDRYFSELLLQSTDIQPNYMQENALENLETCRSEKKQRGLVIAATGTGKTYLSAFDVRAVNAKRVLFLVHNRLILTSAKETFERVFPNKVTLELTSKNVNSLNSADLVFTTDKTAYNKLFNSIDKSYFDYIIYDEAHKIGEDTKYAELIEYFTPKFTLGITATPERTKNAGYLFETFEYSVPYEIRLLDAMNYELVCPFTYYGLNVEDNLMSSDERFDSIKLANFMKGLIKNKGHYGEKLKGIVFCRDKEEATDISRALNNIGFVSIVAISGSKGLTRPEIEQGIQSFSSDEKGTIELICVVNKFNEGIDIPEINTIFMLRNTKSSIIYTQQLGRGLRRTYDINKFVTVFDLIGNSKNDYSIAQVLTGNQTSDKRVLYRHANEGFISVSPYINVHIEKEAMNKIIKSISNNFKVKTMLREKLENELHRYKVIPSLLEMYKNPQFNELELLQLLYKDFYTPFSKYYNKKYNLETGNLFLKNFFRVITQFVFRGYSQSDLRDYVRLLNGERVSNLKLAKTLISAKMENGISTSIYSAYNKKGNDFPIIFKYSNGILELTDEIILALKSVGANDLFNEHKDLFQYLCKNPSYVMKPFELVDKAEFLYNSKSENCYLNAVGEYVDKRTKRVYCPITISKDRKNYSNQILANNRLVYCTQKKQTELKSIQKDNNLITGKYNFHICASFPHLGYEGTSYYNLGELVFESISDTIEHPDGGYYHEFTFLIKNNIPRELLQYQEID